MYHSFTGLQQHSQHNWLRYHAKDLLGQSSSDMRQAHTVSQGKLCQHIAANNATDRLPQRAHILLHSWGLSSKFHPSCEWARGSIVSTQVSRFIYVCYKASPGSDTKFIIKSYFC